MICASSGKIAGGAGKCGATAGRATAGTMDFSDGIVSGFLRRAVSLRKESADTDLGFACARALTANPPKTEGMAVTGLVPRASAKLDIKTFFSHTSQPTNAQECFKLD